MKTFFEILGTGLVKGFFCLILAGIGWLWMRIRYRNKEERDNILAEDYDDSYSDAAYIFIARIVFSILLVGIIIGALVLIYSSIHSMALYCIEHFKT
jgi:hypothetical protein